MNMIDRFLDTPGKSLIVAASAVAATVVSAPATAAVVFDEAVSEDLSDVGLAPTPVSFSVGSNIVQGAGGHNEAGVVDRDYFTFTIGANQTLTAINILLGTQTLGFSFIGLQSGSQVTLPVFPPDATGLLGWYHYSSSDIGTDILDNMSVPANGSTGFTTPLGPGSYSVWVQEISPGGSVPFSFDFVISPVPEPSTWAMTLTGLGLLGLAMRRRKPRGFAQVA